MRAFFRWLGFAMVAGGIAVFPFAIWFRGPWGVITLVWGVALVPNGIVATTELGPTTTDQCELVDDRFTLVSVDAYTGDYVEVRLFGARGAELARESLYEDD